MTIEDTLKQLAEVAKQLQEARKEQIEAVAVHIEEAENRLKEARGVSEVKLSDLPEEELASCKGMWARVKQLNGAVFEGIIIDFDDDGAYVLFPKHGSFSWRLHDQLILLPDHQRVFTSTGDPIKVDHGQWEKTHAMEEEFDRLKAKEGDTTRAVASGGSRRGDGMRLVRILKSDENTGVEKGEIYFAPIFDPDPGKVVLFRRFPDEHDPECLEYVENVEFLTLSRLCAFDDLAAEEWRKLV